MWESTETSLIKVTVNIIKKLYCFAQWTLDINICELILEFEKNKI